jgi:hypothetical protein
VGDDPPWDDSVKYNAASSKSRVCKIAYETLRERFKRSGMTVSNNISKNERTRVVILLNYASKVMIWARSLAQNIDRRIRTNEDSRYTSRRTCLSSTNVLCGVLGRSIL